MKNKIDEKQTNKDEQKDAYKYGIWLLVGGLIFLLLVIKFIMDMI